MNNDHRVVVNTYNNVLGGMSDTNNNVLGRMSDTTTKMEQIRGDDMTTQTTIWTETKAVAVETNAVSRRQMRNGRSKVDEIRGKI